MPKYKKVAIQKMPKLSKTPEISLLLPLNVQKDDRIPSKPSLSSHPDHPSQSAKPPHHFPKPTKHLEKTSIERSQGKPAKIV